MFCTMLFYLRMYIAENMDSVFIFSLHSNLPSHYISRSFSLTLNLLRFFHWFSISLLTFLQSVFHCLFVLSLSHYLSFFSLSSSPVYNIYLLSSAIHALGCYEEKITVFRFATGMAIIQCGSLFYSRTLSQQTIIYYYLHFVQSQHKLEKRNTNDEFCSPNAMRGKKLPD